jgi:ribose-phosphate pyrophosphokinase
MIDTAGTLKAAAQTVLESARGRSYAARPTRALRHAVREPRRRGVRGDRRHRHDPAAPRRPDHIRVLSCADLLTDSIRRIFTDDSVSEVFGGENQLF